MKLVMLLKMLLNYICCKVHVDKYLSGVFSVQNGLNETKRFSPTAFHIFLYNMSLEMSKKERQD
jgi:hypothetical protein